MKYEQLFYSLIERYTRASAAHAYILGFTQGGTVYAAIATSDMLPEVCTIDRASRGAGMALRFKPTVAIKRHLMETCDCISRYAVKSTLSNVATLVNTIRARCSNAWLQSTSAKPGIRIVYLSRKQAI